MQKPKSLKEINNWFVPGKLYLANSNKMMLWNGGVAQYSHTTDVLLFLKLEIMKNKDYVELSFLFHGTVYKSYFINDSWSKHKDYWSNKIIELQ